MSYTITTILSTDTIGDSLVNVNDNYYNLDQWLTSIQLSATNYWIPLRNFYKNISTELKSNNIRGESNKSKWDSLATTVETNSAKWLEPVVVIYPNIVTPNQVNDDNTLTVVCYNQVTEWFNENFDPAKNINESPLYVQGQKAIVYVIKQELSPALNIVNLLQNSGSCTTVDTSVCVYCENSYAGYVNCSNGDFSCGGTTGCTQCVGVPCTYPQTGTRNYSPTIQAYLNINWNEIHESTNISCLNFEIQDCQWVYKSQT